MGTTPRIDFAGGEFLRELHRQLAARGITVRLAEPNGWVRDALQRIGYDQGSDDSIASVIAGWEARRAA